MNDSFMFKFSSMNILLAMSSSVLFCIDFSGCFLEVPVMRFVWYFLASLLIVCCEAPSLRILCISLFVSPAAPL